MACASALAVAVVWAAPARAAFPYLPASGGDANDPTTFKLAPGEHPNDLNDDWKLAATPENSAQSNLLNNRKQDELCGIRGASVVDQSATFPTLTLPPPATACNALAGTPVKTAWEHTTGRPDVTIAVMDSGIEWDDAGAMSDLRKKVRLNKGELPKPNADRPTPLDGAKPCAQFDTSNYDANGDGVFNVTDYACDGRVHDTNAESPNRVGPDGVLIPQDIIIAFSSATNAPGYGGVDNDGNGYGDDIAGWDFVDNDNDPYDDVHYGHGTGEARDSNAEANNGNDLGTCPNCTVVPLRVGQSFVADVNRFAQAVTYATDNDVLVIQEALGTLNNSLFARQAIDYAYNHGVTVIASAADEAAEHHNQPSELPHVIVVNSVTQYADISGVPFTPATPSYLQFNGCTNFSTKITVAVPSSSCSSEATGKSAGMAGLIYSAARNANITPSTHCTRTDGSACLITPNEVRQIMASGNIGSTAPADTGTGQTDDVDFGLNPSPKSCSLMPATCTDPNSFFWAADQNGGNEASPLATTHRYPAGKGFDEFYGYGRLNAYKAVSAVDAGKVPPEADITSPDWFQQLDPNQATIAIQGSVAARTGYTCQVYVAPGAQPNNDSDFQAVPSSVCDGSTRSTPFSGTLASVDVAQLKSRFLISNVGSFNGREPGLAGAQTSNGRPNTNPYAFTVRVVVTTASGTPMSGEDRRQMFLHRDQDMLPGFPKELKTDGASSPLFADLDGDNRNELVIATSDGVVHAFHPDGSELPGWPVHTDQLPLHSSARGFTTGGLGTDHYGAVLGGVAAGDLFHDGRLEVLAADNDGKVYAWDAAGNQVFKQEANKNFSGAPLTPFVNVRKNSRDRTEHGFVTAPVVANIDGSPTPEIVISGEDRHLYAWHSDGTEVFDPVLIVDPDKTAAVDPTTHHVTFKNADPNPGREEGQGKLVDTPAIAPLDGPNSPPSIVVGSNEEYVAGTGNEGSINAGGVTAASLGAVGTTGALTLGNSRLYVVKSTGGAGGSAFRAGWPKKIGIINAGLLPDVGEGISGSPITAPVTCASGGGGVKIGVMPDAGPAYIFNPDGSSCYGATSGADNPLEVDFSAGPTQYDHPAFPAVGNPAFGSFDGVTVSFFAPVAGLQRALDVVAPEYQGGQDFVASWNPTTGQYNTGFPTPVNDLQFLTGQAIGDIAGLPGSPQQVIGGTASLDLAAFNASGTPASPNWPKLTGDWTVATPLLGSFGTLDTDASAHKDVVSLTRAGTLAVYSTPAGACSPSSSPRFHHDIANSGDFSRDAVPPGVPYNANLANNTTLNFNAPGDDLLCGTATGYEVRQSDNPITPQNFAQAEVVPGVTAPAPSAAGTQQTLTLPANTKAHVAVRAVDDQGNLGRPVDVATGRAQQHGGAGGTSGSSGPHSGGALGSGGSGSGSSRPSITALSLVRSRFAVGSAPTALSGRRRRRPARGTKFLFTLNKPATVRFRIERLLAGRRVRGKCRAPTRARRFKPRCTRVSLAGVISRRSGAGSRSTPFSGRLGGHALAPGNYRAVVTATDANGAVSAARQVSFTVVRG
ncbi:MAG: hypothetical protein QOK04_2918 [Solirubrobacteraceae bacterium]|nr:hypothetical protein [Solirubrobacteraceae bacterium]